MEDSEGNPYCSTRIICEWICLGLPLLLIQWPSSAIGVILLLVMYYAETKLITNPAAPYKNFRTEANPGTWCCMLVFSVVLLGFHRMETLTEFNRCLYVQACITLLVSFLFVYTFIYGYFSCIHCPITRLLLAAAIVTITGHILQLNLFKSILASMLTQVLFLMLMLIIPSTYPQSFTMGETFVMIHSIVFFTTHALTDFMDAYFFDHDVPVQKEATRFAQVALVGCEVAVVLWMSFSTLRSPVGFYLTGASVATFFILPGMYIVLNQNPFLWFFNYLALHSYRVLLLISWFVISSVTVWLAVVFAKTGVKVNTIHRKFFHGVILLIYLPALMIDPELLRLCSMITFGLFIVVECIRVMKIPPLGEILSQSLQCFLDEKDQGMLILSHIYLLLGCSFPLWLNPVTDDNVTNAVVLCGIVSIGIGDAVAAIGGKAFGKHQLPGTKKTLEGTLMSMLAQLLIVFVMYKSGFFLWPSNTIMLLAAIISSTLLEAFTLQVDNIVVPLYSYLVWLAAEKKYSSE